MKKVKFEIKNRYTGSVLFEYEKEDNTLKETVEQAVKRGAYLGGADLGGAYLGRADLGGAYIYVCDSDDNLTIKDEVEKFEKNAGIKITKTYVNHDIYPTRWNCFWRNGLIIREYEIPEKEVKRMTHAEICEALGYDVEIIKEAE